jgi:hypothetical protein
VPIAIQREEEEALHNLAATAGALLERGAVVVVVVGEVVCGMVLRMMGMRI